LAFRRESVLRYRQYQYSTCFIHVPPVCARRPRLCLTRSSIGRVWRNAMQSSGQVDADHPIDVFDELASREVLKTIKHEGPCRTSELSRRSCHRASSNEASRRHVEGSGNTHCQDCLLGGSASMKVLLGERWLVSVGVSTSVPLQFSTPSRGPTRVWSLVRAQVGEPRMTGLAGECLLIPLSFGPIRVRNRSRTGPKFG